MIKLSSISKWLLSFSILFICSLLLFRKNIAYFEIGPLYYIEAIVLLLVFFLFLIIKRFKVNNALIDLCIIQLIFIIYSFVIFVFSPGDPKGYIPYFYGLYFIFFLQFFYWIFKFIKEKNQSNTFESLLKNSFYLLLLSPILLNKFEIIAPGNTLLYSISFFYIILFEKNTFKQIILISFYILAFFLSLERAILVNTFIPLFLMIIPLSRLKGKQVSRLFFFNILLIFFILSNIKMINEFLVDFNIFEQRFELTAENLLSFVQTIWDSNVQMDSGGAIGSKNHRIEMWIEIINDTSSSLNKFLFGIGFEGFIIQNNFGGIPHNGYLSIFRRTGIIGLSIFFMFLYKLYKLICHSLLESPVHKLFIELSFLAFCLEMMTGTIIDSPFTLIIFYFLIAFYISKFLVKK